MKVGNSNGIVRLACFALIFFFLGCGASGDSDLENLNGTWQNPSNQQKVVIKMTGNQKTIAIGDNTLPVTVKKIEEDIFKIHVSDKTLGEKDWKLVRVWDDNGKSFTIKLEREGAVDNLTRM